MKKILIALVAVLAFVLSSNEVDAQQRTKLADGFYLVKYGNTYTIEDDKTQQCITLSVERRKDNYGRPIYDIFCGNKYTKGLIKTTLQSGITRAFTSAGAAIGASVSGGAATVTGASIGAFLSRYANDLASLIYDDICDYYGD